jgi:hypothetical protein
MWYDSTVHRLFQDDLASVSISRLRASGFVTSDTKSVDIIFGEGDEASGARSRLFTAAFPTAANGRFSFALFAVVLCAFLSCTTSRCVGAALSRQR